MPLISSIIGRRIGPYVIPYANILGLNATWEFFSPDPPAPLYFDYTIYFEDEEGNEVAPSIDGTFPEGGLEFTNNPNKIRLKTSVRLLAMSQGKTDSIFISYLCRQHPKATRVYLKPVIELLPPIEKVIANGGEVNVASMQTDPIERRCEDLRREIAAESEARPPTLPSGISLSFNPNQQNGGEYNETKN